MNVKAYAIPSRDEFVAYFRQIAAAHNPPAKFDIEREANRFFDEYDSARKVREKRGDRFCFWPIICKRCVKIAIMRCRIYHRVPKRARNTTTSPTESMA